MHFGAGLRGTRRLQLRGFARDCSVSQTLKVECLQSGAAVVLPNGLTMRESTFKLQNPCSFMLVHAIRS